MGPAGALIGVLISVTAAGRSSIGGHEGSLTLEDRQKILAIAHELESDPLGPVAATHRSWAMSRLIESPDLTIHVCLELVGPTLESDRRHLIEPAFQLAISGAAFIFENPQQASDMSAMSLAGLNGVLRAYERGLQANPKSRIRFLDKLVKEREAGRLAAVVRDGLAKCGI